MTMLRVVTHDKSNAKNNTKKHNFRRSQIDTYLYILWSPKASAYIDSSLRRSPVAWATSLEYKGEAR
jgi:hypothetical protein